MSELNKIDYDAIGFCEGILQADYRNNENFNRALDNNSRVRVSSLLNSNGYEFLPSEILFWVDRSAYNEEKENWEERMSHELHSEATTRISKESAVPVFYDLVDAIRRRRIAPFVGAGLSQVPNKEGGNQFPMWGQALTEMKQKILPRNSDDFDSAMVNYDYLKAAQILWDEGAVQVKQYIRNSFDRSLSPNNRITGAVKLLKDLAQGCIITTNFDYVIESVFSDRPFEGYMHGIQQGNKFVPKLIKGDRCILKLHGDAEDIETFIFTEEQYRAGYGETFDFSKPLPRALRQIFISHSLLFLGCSLEQDRTLDLFSQVVSEKHFEIPDHFAIIEEPKDLEKKVEKDNRLVNLKIRPLWYPHGEHQYVEQILRLAIACSKGVVTPF